MFRFSPDFKYTTIFFHLTGKVSFSVLYGMMEGWSVCNIVTEKGSSDESQYLDRSLCFEKVFLNVLVGIFPKKGRRS